MMNITSKLNLRQLKSIVKEMKRKDGSKVECLVIPIQPNNLFKGEKGIYLDLQHYELKNKKEGSKDTHLIKQSLPKEVYERMSEDEKKAAPIIGNSIVWNGNQEQEPNELDNYLSGDSDDDDLPF